MTAAALSGRFGTPIASSTSGQSATTLSARSGVDSDDVSTASPVAWRGKSGSPTVNAVAAGHVSRSHARTSSSYTSFQAISRSAFIGASDWAISSARIVSTYSVSLCRPTSCPRAGGKLVRSSGSPSARGANFPENRDPPWPHKSIPPRRREISPRVRTPTAKAMAAASAALCGPKPLTKNAEEPASTGRRYRHGELEEAIKPG